MASAGRILIMPKGNYDSSATYEMLDMVAYNGTSWVAKKTTKGIEPSAANNEYWQNLFNMDANDYLRLSGGTLTGRLVLGGGSGSLGSGTDGAYIESRTDDSNYRGIKIDSQSVSEDVSKSLKFVDSVDGKAINYTLFGEHNIDYLKQLLGLT